MLTYKWLANILTSRKHRDAVIRRWPPALARRRPVLSTNDSMSDHNSSAEKRTDTAQITNLRDLRRGDRVLFDDRSRPLTVVDLGERHLQLGDQELTTPLVRVRGEWDGAVDVVLAHVSRHLGDDQASVVLEEHEQIIAAEGGDLSNGEPVDVERVDASASESTTCEVTA